MCQVQNIKVILIVIFSVCWTEILFMTRVIYSTVFYIPQTNFHLYTVDEMLFTLVLRLSKFRINQKQFSQDQSLTCGPWYTEMEILPAATVMFT